MCTPLGVVYRDLKPENVLLDARGHVRLTDFGLSKEGHAPRERGALFLWYSGILSTGNPGETGPRPRGGLVVARRVAVRNAHGAAPVLLQRPGEALEGIKHGELGYPGHLSPDAKAILRALLERDPARRLGSGPGDADEIRAHTFFARVDWDALLDGTAPPPWQPTVVGSLDTSQFDREFTSLPIHSPPPRAPRDAAGSTPQDDTFSGFTYSERRLHATRRDAEERAALMERKFPGRLQGRPPMPPDGAVGAPLVLLCPRHAPPA